MQTKFDQKYKKPATFAPTAAAMHAHVERTLSAKYEPCIYRTEMLTLWCGVWSVGCGVWSVENGVRASAWLSMTCVFVKE